MGQVYVLFSRVTDPRHLELIGRTTLFVSKLPISRHISTTRGLPPADILEDVCRAWERAGIDVVESLRRATTVTNEWVYTPTADGDMRSRLTQLLVKERTVPVVLKDLYEVIDAQPRALAVIKKLLDWISRVDLASQQGLPRPVFKTVGGDPIFPPEEEQWWLTDFQQRKKPEEIAGDEDGPPTEAEEEEKDDTDDEDPTSEEEAAEQGGGHQNDPTFRPATAWRKGSI